MLELIARLEKATGPDRELDVQITLAINEGSRRHVDEGMISVLKTDNTYAELPKYTSSIDAALTLVPEGWRVQLYEMSLFGGGWKARLLRDDGDIRVIDSGQDGQLAEGEGPKLFSRPAPAICVVGLKARALLRCLDNDN